MTDMQGHVCGCYYNTFDENVYLRQRHYLPQVTLVSHTTITPIFFTTRLSQTFSNSSDEAIPEARYTFPLYDGVAVTAFTCTVGDRVIKGRVEEKDQARKTYDAAVEKGESAGLLESLPVGVFGLNIGNVPAKAVIKVDVIYGGELKHDAQVDGLRYILPTSICPRYGAYPGELLQPDTAVARGMQISVDINMQGSAIRKVQSPSKDYPISVSIGSLSTESSDATLDTSKASVTLSHETTELGSDFVLQIMVDAIAAPKAILETHSRLADRHALMTTFVPKFNLQPTRPEIIFIADQSSSMGGSKNDALVAALKIFLKSLPAGVRFNIYAFGSVLEPLWDQSKAYGRETVEQALNFVQEFDAALGGTELRDPIEMAFEKHFHDLPLEVIILTDGEIYQERRLFEFISDQIHWKGVDARCFVLGVGDDVSHTLVEGVARAGNGIAQFVLPGEVLDYKVVRMLKSALYPHIEDATLEVEYDSSADEDFEMVGDETSETETAANTDSPKVTISLYDTAADRDQHLSDGASQDVPLPHVAIPDIIQAPHILPTLLPFNRTTVHVLLHGTVKTPKSVIIRATCSQGPLELKIPVQRLDNTDNVINSLAARKAVQDLDEGRSWLSDLAAHKYPSRHEELVKREIVRLGVEYQVTNKWCSFVVVQDHGVFEQVLAEVEYDAVEESCDDDEDEDMGFSLFDCAPAPARRRSAAAAGFIGCGGYSNATVGRGHNTADESDKDTGSDRLDDDTEPTPTAERPRFLRDDDDSDSDPTSDPRDDDSDSTVPTSSSILATLRALINLQHYDGCWQWNDELAAFFDHAVAAGVGNDARETGTAVVLAWLQVSANEHRELWDMVAEKGFEYLGAKGADGAVQRARRVFEGLSWTCLL